MTGQAEERIVYAGDNSSLTHGDGGGGGDWWYEPEAKGTPVAAQRKRADGKAEVSTAWFQWYSRLLVEYGVHGHLALSVISSAVGCPIDLCNADMST